MSAAHPVYLYSPGGSFIQTPDGRPLLAQAGYVGDPNASTGTQAGQARGQSANTAKGDTARQARTAATYEAKA